MEIYPWTLSIVARHTFPLIDEHPGLYLPTGYCLICMNGLLQTHGNVNERHPPAGRSPTTCSRPRHNGAAVV
jgi:hypothetical protein